MKLSNCAMQSTSLSVQIGRRRQLSRSSTSPLVCLHLNFAEQPAEKSKKTIKKLRQQHDSGVAVAMRAGTASKRKERVNKVGDKEREDKKDKRSKSYQQLPY